MRPGVVITALALFAALLIPVITKNGYYLDVLIMAFIWSIAASGLNVLLGYTGLLSLAHAAFFGIGAYTVGILMLKHGWSFWLAWPTATALTTVLGFLLGLVAFRTRGDAFAIFTLAVGVIVTQVIARWEHLTGGRDGLNGVPQPGKVGPIDFSEQSVFYYLALGALVATLYVIYSVVKAPVGRAFVAVRSNEDLARASGIDTFAHKQRALMLSTAIAGLAGGLYATYLGFLGPAASAVTVTFTLLLYVIVGGAATLAGPVIGAFLLVVLAQLLQASQEYQHLILGPLLVVLVLFFPHGLMGLWQKATRRFNRPAPAPAVIATSQEAERAQR
ncbi:branched-chain amino acid ABC transporter permease [Deinococcus peraridilitoris]|uniref:ABC-type branched-chain amino acid transport system, permease component n=1 Tax=Deinococcus peraridilitoris (strain DSM 19664 / LMG 22246 / CIP 109416 / KR-200) TaxID=937777 RepID=L0A0R4_DEIPD|nr:branched-chain amino acid ABC transporter permease [Deinococcus peraridilitoris]AFZ66762.1 ABC-type branched-chain amino acid transport system, permease component [Deinococcus peraridilitoris DSM 19664]